MSKFADKAEAIVAEGEAKRKEWTPSGVPLRLYNFWLESSTSKKAREIKYGSRKENFCHFWRVVAIWAPLNWLGDKVDAVLSHRFTMPTIVTLCVVGFFAAVLLGGGLPGLFWVAVGVVGLVAAVAVLVGVSALIDRYPNGSKKLGLFLLKAVGVLAGIGAVVGFVWLTGWFGIAALVVGGILGGLVTLNIERIGEWIEDWRERSEAAERARRAKRSAELNAYFNEHGYYPSEAPAKEPGRVKKFFTGVGDLIIMLAQVARVKKWGICPLVEIEREKIDYDSGWETA